MLLVVDDEPDIAISLQAFLEQGIPGLKVMTASSGALGLEILRQNRVDVILTDHRMPGMTGLEFLQKATALAPHAPRILLTAFPDIPLALQALQEHRVAHVFRKPCKPDELREVVVAILEDSFTKAGRADAFRRSLELSRGRP